MKQTIINENLVISLKTAEGTDPSAEDPIYVKVGDTVRAVTTPLKIARNVGSSKVEPAWSSNRSSTEVFYYIKDGQVHVEMSIQGTKRRRYFYRSIAPGVIVVKRNRFYKYGVQS